MKKMSMIGATLLGAAVLCAVPISLHQSQNKGLSLSLDSADAACIGAPTGGQCGAATKTLRSRQCDRDEPRGGASGNIDDRTIQNTGLSTHANGIP
jgi:hypothetical protein